MGLAGSRPTGDQPQRAAQRGGAGDALPVGLGGARVRCGDVDGAEQALDDRARRAGVDVEAARDARADPRGDAPLPVPVAAQIQAAPGEHQRRGVVRIAVDVVERA
ncbi:hypothetical protein GALL_521740 [mine drainage metagenome]|uniref:Uncharacterized protein n=1 Tax=mine drainage metagenome TaxID=410659 RepID=A0A1J5P3Y8_9ZZZZ